MIHHSSIPARLARPVGIAAATALVLAFPAVAAAHGLSPSYQSPLPLAVYLIGAATTVALSFAFVLLRDVRAEIPPRGPIIRVAGPIRLLLRAIGLIGWLWILAQTITGGSSDAAVSSLFLWVYGWVGVAMLSALLFPAWEWIDPFTTIHDIIAWPLRQLGVQGWEPSELPAWAAYWPAVVGFGFFVWLELVAVPGTQALGVVLVGYTVITLALMAQFGRDQWRARGETFCVWFRTLNRIAPFGVVPAAWTADEADVDELDPDAIDLTSVERRSFASALLRGPWAPGQVALIAVGVASIIFDGFSQTVPFASAFGAPTLVPKTLLLLAWLVIVAGAAFLVGRSISFGAIGAGMLPIAVGYLIAHYLTYLLIDGQRIVIAISDPLQQGADLFGTAFFQPNGAWLPPGLVWTAQLAAVVGGHMLGAWAGHVTAQRDIEAAAAAGGRDRRHRKIATASRRPNVRAREVPLAAVMVALTTITLFSLGQAIVVQKPAAAMTRPAPRAAAIHGPSPGT